MNELGRLQLWGSTARISKPTYRPPSRHGSSWLNINAGRSSASRNLSWTLTLRRWFLQMSYLATLVSIALYASVTIEDVARRLSRLQHTPWPQAMQTVVNFVGTGVMDPVKPLPLEPQTTVSSLTMPQQVNWRAIPIEEETPVVLIASHVPKEPDHPAIQVLKQARRNNNLVYLLGPRKLPHLEILDIIVEPKEDYSETIDWVWANIGNVKMDVFRWWMLRAFMQRHSYKRVLLLSVEVMLYANATELTSWLFPNTKLALPVRWPSMLPPPLPSQYTSTPVSAHVGIWSLEGVSDFVEFWKVALEVALFGGEPGSLETAKKKEYSEQNLLGWYSYSDCWQSAALDPPCMAEPKIGITAALAAKIRGKFKPKFAVDSLCQPRWCQNTTWSDFGLCVFDNNFSVATPSRFFKFAVRGKCPSSKLYEFYDAWMGGAPKRNVQFLAVHFQGSRRDFLRLEDQDPSKSWGSSPF